MPYTKASAAMECPACDGFGMVATHWLYGTLCPACAGRGHLAPTRWRQLLAELDAPAPAPAPEPGRRRA